MPQEFFDSNNARLLDTSFFMKIVNYIKNRHFFLYAFTILVFTLPRALQPIKILLLLLLLSFGIFLIKIKKSFILLSFIYSLLFVVPLATAFLYKNNINYVFNSLKINLLFPLLLFFILQQFSIDDLTKVIRNSAAVSTLFIIFITFTTLFFNLGLFPFNLNTIFYEKENAIGLDYGYIHIINSSLSYLIYITPLFLIEKKAFSLKNYTFYLFVFSFITAAISGRRILLLPFIIVIGLNFKKIVLPLLIFFVLSYIIVDKSVFESFDFDIVISRFQDAINSEGDSSVRKEQSIMFDKHISESPMLGKGLGSFMENYKRSEEFETAYEDTLGYMMFSLGIPVTVLTILYYGFLMFKTYLNNYIVEQRFKIALIFATISILIASTTNPYWLSSFDFCLPLAILMRFSQEDIFNK